MKKISTFILTFVSSHLFCQLQPTGTIVPAYRFGETQIGGILGTNNIRSIGIGNFSTLGGGATPQARLHVNSFYFPASNIGTAFLAGNLFRTDGNNNVVNQWQLFTGATAGGATEKFVLSVAANATSDVSLTANTGVLSLNTAANQPMQFFTNNTQRLKIFGGGNSAFDGRIAIGNSLPIGFSPEARLHIYQMQETTNLNGNMFRTDGLSDVLNQFQMFTDLNEIFRLSIPEFTQDVLLNSVDPGGNMQLQTTSFTRLLIHNGYNGIAQGRVAIGNELPSTFAPSARLQLHQTSGAVNLRFSNNFTGSTNDQGFEINMASDGEANFITHELDKRFNWLSGVPGFSLKTRMRLYGGNTGQDKGRLALGNDLPYDFEPMARLHISQITENLTFPNGNMFRSDGLQSTLNQIQMFTGLDQESLTEKLKLFIPGSSTAVGLQATDEDGFVFINTGGANERFRIFNNTNSPSTPFGGGVAIHIDPSNPVNQPGALLHIGQKFNASITGQQGYYGWRNWMNIGKFDFGGSDNMYVGLKEEVEGEAPPELPTGLPGDRQDAVINWGDNGSSGNINPPVGPDYLRFIHTQTFQSGAPAGTAGNIHGLEIARMAPNSFMGIGNFYNNPLFATKDPARRLEILSDKTTDIDNGTPQFRITHTQQGNVSSIATGKFTDFHTNNNGDLAILTNDNTQTNTADKTLKQRFVGINTNTPNNTLEINSQFVSATTPNGNGTATGWAGLRFTDLNSTSIVQDNASNKVLSVDASGDVILVNDLNAPSLGNICGASTTNPLTNNWQIPLNSKNFLFTEAIGGTGKVGIGAITTCAPGNLLEVKKGVTSNISGLRLTDLATATPGVTSTKMLSVNSSGDVILVNAPVSGGGGTIANNGCSIGTGGNVVLGNVVGGTDATLLDNREIPLGGRYLYFSGTGLPNNADRIYIGDIITGGAPISGKLQSYHKGKAAVRSAINGITDGSTTSAQTMGVTGYAYNGLNDSYGVKGDASNAVDNNVGVFGNANGIGASISYGVMGQAISTFSNHNRGASFLAKDGISTNYGVISQATVSSISTASNYGASITAQYGGTVYGINASASGFGGSATTVYGLNSKATGPSSIGNYGVKAEASGSDPLTGGFNYAIYGTVPTGTNNYAGYFNGKVHVVGQISSSNGTVIVSDQTFKQNIQPINNANTIISQLNARTFNFDSLAYPQFQFSSEQKMGLIAQEVEQILPSLVKPTIMPAQYDTLGNQISPSTTYKTLDYQQFIPLLIAGMQEQKSTIDSMRTIMSQMTNLINTCCQNTSTRTQTTANNTVIDVELSDKDIIVLNQNVPNPFAEQTTIAYNVPEKSGFAQIIFNDMKGQIIKVVDIKTKGKGQLNVFANDLSTGMYTYSLYVDGKLIDTKKMVKTE